MLSDRERHDLDLIERQLCASDPRLAARFRSLDRPRTRRAGRGSGRSMHDAGVLPCLMLAAGLLMLIVGAAAGAITVVVAGVVLAVLTLGVAATRAPRPGPGFA